MTDHTSARRPPPRPSPSAYLPSKKPPSTTGSTPISNPTSTARSATRSSSHRQVPPPIPLLRSSVTAAVRTPRSSTLHLPTSASAARTTTKPTIASLARSSASFTQSRGSKAPAATSSLSTVAAAAVTVSRRRTRRPSEAASAPVTPLIDDPPQSKTRRLSTVSSSSPRSPTGTATVPTTASSVPGLVIVGPVPAAARARSTRSSISTSRASVKRPPSGRSSVVSTKSSSPSSRKPASPSVSTPPSASPSLSLPPHNAQNPPPVKRGHSSSSSSISSIVSDASSHKNPDSPVTSSPPQSAQNLVDSAPNSVTSAPAPTATTTSLALSTPRLAGSVAAAAAILSRPRAAKQQPALLQTSRQSSLSLKSPITESPTKLSESPIEALPVSSSQPAKSTVGASVSSSRRKSSTPAMPVVKAASTVGTSASSRNGPFTPKVAGTSTAGRGMRIASTSSSSTISSMAAGTRKRGSLNAGEPLPSHDYHHMPPTSAPKLTSNITPRSGTRQNRVDGSNSTPLGTPNGLYDTFDTDTLRRQALSPQQPPTPKDDLDAKFFYASDVNAKLPSAPRLAPPAQKQGFMYANGQSESPTQRSASTNYPYKAPSQLGDDLSNKFFYANGTPDVEPSHRSSVSSSSNSTNPRSRPPSGVMPSPGFVAAQRPLSPKKAPSAVSPPLKPPTQGRPMSISNPPPMAPPSGPPSQRVSMDGHPVRGHARSGSNYSQPDHPMLGSGPASPQQQQQRPITMAPTVQSPQAMQPNLTMAPIPQDPDEMDSDEDIDMTSDYDSDSGSASGSGSGSEDDEEQPVVVTDNVINARSQRKVQDLEIRNASLEAINRTLERQMRKQQAELRRFRRMSRAKAANSLQVPGADGSVLSDLAEEDGMSDIQDESGLSADERRPSMSESITASVTNAKNQLHNDAAAGEDSDEEMEDQDSVISSSDESNDDPLSPAAMREKELRQQSRDQRRLQLDLTKHRELLIDSQKINESLKRCLNWTEELIKEGRKALVYQVHVPDTKVGGRVLDPLDLETDDEEGDTSDYPLFYSRAGAVSPSVAESGQETENEQDEEDDGEDTETETEGEGGRTKSRRGAA